MCSIFGLGFVQNHLATNNDMIRSILRRMFIANQASGRTASGLACITGSEMYVVKKNVAGEDFIELPEYKQMEKKYVNFTPNAPWGQNTVSFVGHCRLRTKGSELVNDNNHPIVRDNLIGVHNGMIGNDDRLFEIYGKSLKRNGQVDSEAIFALIEYFAKSEKRRIHEAIQRAAVTLQGSFACAMVHQLHPHVVWLFRRQNPCKVVFFRDVGMLIWSTCEAYINRALKPYEPELGRGEYIGLDPNEGISIDLYRNYIYRFNLCNYNAMNQYA